MESLQIESTQYSYNSRRVVETHWSSVIREQPKKGLSQHTLFLHLEKDSLDFLEFLNLQFSLISIILNHLFFLQYLIFKKVEVKTHMKTKCHSTYSRQGQKWMSSCILYVRRCRLNEMLTQRIDQWHWRFHIEHHSTFHCAHQMSHLFRLQSSNSQSCYVKD